MKSTMIKRSRDDLIFDIVVYIILTLAFLVVLYPLYFVVIASFSDPSAVLTGQVFLFPKDITIVGYKRIIENKAIITGYANTFVYTLVGTAFNVAMTMTISYPLSRKKFSGRVPIMMFLMVTMYISGGMIPTYLLVRDLGLRDTRLVMVLLGAVSVFNILITRTFLESNIPSELEEAASIDGCAPIMFFLKCVLPLSSSILAVLVLYYGIGHWNDYMRSLIYLNDAQKYPLQLVLRAILIQSEIALGLDTGDPLDIQQQMKIAEQIKYGVIIVSSLPLLVLYPFLQKYFVKGVMIGSIKG